MGHRFAVSIIAALTVVSVAACGSDDEDPPAPPPAAAASATSAPVAPSAGPGSAAGPQDGTTATGKPEIVTNPDGTINSGGPRPATSDRAVTAGGFGPYKIGVSQDDLRSAGLIGKVTASKSENCPGYAGAKGIGKYRSPSLLFFQGRLLRLTVTGGGVETDKGVKIGSRMADVQGAYPGGKQLDDWTGKRAWFATVGDYGLLFLLTDGKVSSIQSGMAEPMQYKYTDDQGC